MFEHYCQLLPVLETHCIWSLTSTTCTIGLLYLNTVVNNCRERVDLLETYCIWTLSWTTWLSSDYCICTLSSVAWSTGDKLYVVTFVNNMIYCRQMICNHRRQQHDLLETNYMLITVNNMIYWRQIVCWSPSSTTWSTGDKLYVDHRRQQHDLLET